MTPPPSSAPGTVDLPRLTGDDSQQVFDALLRSLAEPGTLRQLPAAWCAAVAPVLLGPLALADVDVTVSVEGDDGPEHAVALSRATGAPRAPLAEAAIVAVAAGVDDVAAVLATVRTGDALAPELGARVFVAVDDLTVGDLTVGEDGNAPATDDTDDTGDVAPGGRRVRLALRGPGVPGTRTLEVDGLDVDAAARLGRASAPFPAGIDVWLVAPDGTLAGIPRSTTVDVETDRPADAGDHPAAADIDTHTDTGSC